MSEWMNTVETRTLKQLLGQVANRKTTSSSKLRVRAFFLKKVNKKKLCARDREFPTSFGGRKKQTQPAAGERGRISAAGVSVDTLEPALLGSYEVRVGSCYACCRMLTRCRCLAHEHSQNSPTTQMEKA